MGSVIRKRMMMPVIHGNITSPRIKNSLNSGFIIVTEFDDFRNKGVIIVPVTMSVKIAISVKTISSAANTLLIKSHSET